ncbi:MAG: hypothetical protein LBC17_00015 [Lactobacillaceae bacterium]|nr:hypothetical protein [Lactobacillaceae bacterium]
MKKIKLSFDLITNIFIAGFFVNMLLIFINREIMNVWTYLLFAGIIPVLFLAIFNSLLLRNNQFKRTLLITIIISFLEAIIITAVSSLINLQQIIANTKKVGPDFSLSLSVDNDMLGNFLTTWLPLLGISLLITSLSTYIIKKKKGYYYKNYEKIITSWF